MSKSYDDNVRKDVREHKIAHAGKTLKIEGNWSLEQLSSLSTDLTEKVQSLSSLSDLVQLSVALGRLGRNLDLSGGPATDGTIRHLLGTILVAIDITCQGHIVKAIEGCDHKGVQVMGDLDLLYVKHGEYVAVDYTQHGSPRSGISVLQENSSKLIREKYSKLKSIYPSYKQEVVCHGNAPVVKLNLNLKNFTSPREDDFSAVDKLVPLLRKMSLDKAEEALRVYAEDSVKHKVDARGMVESPRNAPIDGIHSMLSKNGMEQAEQYERFRTKLSPQSMDKFYSGAHYESWCDTVVKADFKYPLYKRGNKETDPFSRVRSIVDMMDLFQHKVDSMLRAIASLEHQDTAEFFTPNGIAVVTRMRKDDAPFNAVQFHFPKGWSMAKMRESRKKLVPGLNFNGDLYEMESHFEQMDKEFMSEGQGGMDLESIADCAQATMTGALGDQVRRIMKAQLKTISTTKIGSWMSQKQEITRALLSVPRKRKSLKKIKGGYFEEFYTASLDTISDRHAVLLTGLGPATFSGSDMWNYLILGDGENLHGCLRSVDGLSRVLSVSRAMLDWDCTILARSISYYTHITEMRIATQGKSVELSHERSFPMMLMQQNNNKFAQASEMVRYLFVNCTGWSASPKSLYEKIGWFSPTTFTQKLYILRLCKMCDGLLALRSHDAVSKLRVVQVGQVPTKEGGYMERKSEYWDVAMPNELQSSRSDHALFNSFYVCRAMTMQRYNKLVSEALVIEKQLDAREEYLKIKSEMREHELRFMPELASVDDLLEQLTTVSTAGCGPWSISWRMQALAILATATRLRMDYDKTVGDVFNRIHNLSGVIRTLKVSDVMNSRGSVSCNSKSGVTKYSRKMQEDKKVKTVTQNSKCWHTLLQALQCVLTGTKPPESDYDVLATEAEDEMTLNLDLIKSANDSLWPLILWASDNFAICVSKMVHKDQIGAREIAVLNAWARIMCFYVECLSRTVRDDEHRNGLRTNLIERKDKETIVESMLLSGQANRRQGVSVLFDSADCSKWGPSQMPSNLYLTLSIRMNDPVHNNILRNCLSLFGTKVFKIPDFFYGKVNDMSEGTEKVGAVRKRLLNMSSDMGSFENQYIKLEESMHQGILGVTSSVFGSDAHNLSDLVLKQVYKDLSLTCRTHITSDDYCRLITWNGEGGFYKLAKESLAIHNEILLGCGIKRNLQKSALSSSYMEFNSIFHTYSGSFRPDVKQRLSFIDIGQSPDPEPNAKRCMEMSAEYLRNDGGLIGSCWVSVLNNSLVMHQNQVFRLRSKIGEGIYSVPLELGGLIRPDPLRYVTGTQLVTLYKNYGTDLTQAYNQLLSHNPSEAKGIEAYLDDGGLKVSGMSRSGVVRLSTRPKRASRAIREFMTSLENSFFHGVLEGTEKNSIVLGLIACAHREMTVESSQGPAMRLANCLHVHDAKIFRINNSAYRKEGKLSREDLDDLAVSFYAGDKPDVEDRSTSVDLARLQSMSDSLELFQQTCRVTEMTWMPRKMHKDPVRVDVAPSFYMENALLKFQEDWSPLNRTDILAWDYLEAKEVLKARLKKLSYRRQNILLALMEGDQLGTTLHHKILLSNFSGGCRVHMVGLDSHSMARNVDVLLKDSLTALTNPNYSDSGSIMQFTSPRYPALMRSGKVGKTDITGLLNVLSGDLSYDFTDETLRVQIIHSLCLHLKNHPNRVTVYPARLTKHFSPIEYATSRQLHIQQRALVDRDNTTVGREFILKNNRKWEHRCFITDDTIVFPEDKMDDTYLVTNLCDAQYLDVKLEENLGCSAVALMSGQYLQILSNSILESTTVLMVTNNPMTARLEELEALGMQDARKRGMIEFRDIFTTAVQYHATVEEENAQVAEPLLEDQELEESDYDSDDDDFLNTANDLMSGMMDLVGQVGSVNDPLQHTWSPVDSDSEESAEEEFNLEPEFYRPMSESAASKPLDVMLKLANSSTMRDVTDRYKRSLRLSANQCVYKIEVPYKLAQTRFKDDDRGPAVIKLLETLSDYPEVEANFLRSYILDSIATEPSIVAQFIKREADLASAVSGHDLEEENLIDFV